MSFGLTNNLLFAAFVSALLMILITRKYLRTSHAIAISLVKIAIPLVYFAFCYNGSWTFNDDQNYLYIGRMLLSKGYNPFTIFFSTAGITELFSLSHGSHIMYGWWNFLTQYIFGANYYSPVFMNVMLTAIAAWYLYLISSLAGFEKTYSRVLAVFFLLHWDILAWTSITNLKDTMVLTVTCAIVYHLLSLASEGHRGWRLVRHIAGLVLSLAIMVWLRSYVAMLLLATFLLWATFSLKGKQRSAIIAIVIILGAFAFTKMPGLSGKVLGLINPGGMASGMFRFILTPRPWALETRSSFLLIPASLHWLHLIPASVGGYYLWKRSSITRFVMLYFVCVLLLYGSVGEVQGPRHRVQLTFILAWMQFHFVYLCAKANWRKDAEPALGDLG